MALDLGTLTGYLGLDDAKYDGVLSNLPGKLEMPGAAMKLAAGAAAVGVGMALVGGLTSAIDLDAAQHILSARSRISGEYLLFIVFHPCLKNGTKVRPIHTPGCGILRWSGASPGVLGRLSLRFALLILKGIP